MKDNWLAWVSVFATVSLWNTEITASNGQQANYVYTKNGQKLICDKVIDTFLQADESGFPKGWRTKHEYNAEETREKQLYKVESASDFKGQYVRARYKDHTITIVRKVPKWDLNTYPYFHWRWKAITLPEGADESSRSTNDSTASVYLVWPSKIPLRSKYIRYAWSSTLQKGRHIDRTFGNENIIIQQSGKEEINKWKTEIVDIRMAMLMYIDDKLEAPSIIALTTDADDTKSKAEALYADFRLCRVIQW